MAFSAYYLKLSMLHFQNFLKMHEIFPFEMYEIYEISEIFFSEIYIYRGSRPEVLYEKGVLRNFANFTVKHLYQSLFFNKLAG